jgi:hypothetical protein
MQTTTSYMRRAAAVLALAGAAAAAASAVPGPAHAYPYCPSKAVCLYSDSNLRGIKHVYSCRGWAPGSYISFNLRKDFAVGHINGVSSYQRAAGLRQASLLGGGNIPLYYGHANVPRYMNDWPSTLSMEC